MTKVFLADLPGKPIQKSDADSSDVSIKDQQEPFKVKFIILVWLSIWEETTLQIFSPSFKCKFQKLYIPDQNNEKYSR